VVVKSTMFPHRNINEYTWVFPDGKTHNQIDHILTDRRILSSKLDVRSFRGTDCDTGHCLVVAEFGKGLVVNKQEARKFVVEGFNLRKLSWRLGNSITLRS
jgi:hypothetical protein